MAFTHMASQQTITLNITWNFQHFKFDILMKHNMKVSASQICYNHYTNCHIAMNIDENAGYFIGIHTFLFVSQGVFLGLLIFKTVPSNIKICLFYEMFTQFIFGISIADAFCKAVCYFFHFLILWLIMSLAHPPYHIWPKENKYKILVFKTKDPNCSIATLPKNVH